MTAAPIPQDEAERLQSLWATGLLDSPPSVAFNRITSNVATLLKVPIALVSLVGEQCQWFLSKVGLEVSETPRDISFCGHAVAANQKLHVVDAWQDPRFQGNPLVTGEPHLRAYLGVPLHAEDGQPIGTLCVLERRARTFTAEEQQTLTRYARALEKFIHGRPKG